MAENVMRRDKTKSSPVKRTAGEGSAKAPRVKPVRITVDLDPATHKALKMFAVLAETDASSVVRALLGELQENTTLADTITQRVA